MGTTAATAGVTGGEGEMEHGQPHVTAPLHHMARRPSTGWAATRSSPNTRTTAGWPRGALGAGGGRRGVCRRGVGTT